MSHKAGQENGTENRTEIRDALQQLVERLGETIVGQERLIRGLVIGLLCRGHVLIEGVPGLAKTTAVSSLAAALGTTFRRIQFTPDLLPSDVVGSEIYRPQDHSFEVQTGPIFANLVLVDEINRAPAKVQSALLEAMQERQVTIGGKTLPLPDPFMVLATQNPIDQQGTYALPEAQMDRFLLKLMVRYPQPDDEQQILSRSLAQEIVAVQSDPVLTESRIQQAVEKVRGVSVTEVLQRYIVDLVTATRDPYRFGSEVGDLVEFGVSPRGTIALAFAARAEAFLNDRDYATPDDVRAVIYDVWRHRIVLSFEADAEEMTADEVLSQIIDRVPVP